eukprot:4530997-Pyramimonas_sp.AAC.1
MDFFSGRADFQKKPMHFRMKPIDAPRGPAGALKNPMDFYRTQCFQQHSYGCPEESHGPPPEPYEFHENSHERSKESVGCP